MYLIAAIMSSINIPALDAPLAPIYYIETHNGVLKVQMVFAYRGRYISEGCVSVQIVNIMRSKDRIIVVLGQRKQLRLFLQSYQ